MKKPDTLPHAKKVELRLKGIYNRLIQSFGPQNWWPGESAFEVMVGAILTQNTAWSNVEKAITNLKTEKLLEPERLACFPKEKLALLIKPAGYYNLKADRLMNLINLIMTDDGGDPPLLLKRPPEQLRQDLLKVKGIGPETADSILLYAAGYPVFVIDAYTRRILGRHRLAEGNESYEDLQKLFMENLPHDPILYNEYHALLVHLGKHFCKPTPICDGCPLEELEAEPAF
ncbi:MAG: endonuclease III domain-containing protein [Deltaproteobacteria bacterium]|nr:endonuclease III domain-containing protein [Deltaproteobacteria bacterium]MBW2052252.1 endonuclease III domain-containing protein [Deltaproteobacteria bacterium]MBW2141140.1 endonuclease III domain-containing protein [Deltaproteobacteria bacterium]